MRKTLLATAMMAVVCTPAIANTTYRNDGQWQVWQATLDGGSQVCFMRNAVNTTAGEATFGWSQNQTRSNLMLHYTEPNWQWTKAKGQVTFRVDGQPPVTADMTADGGMLYIAADQHSPVLRKFFMDFGYGSTLYVSTNSGTRTFSLTGSMAAIADMSRCMDAITGTRPAPAPVHPIAPAIPYRMM